MSENLKKELFDLFEGGGSNGGLFISEDDQNLLYKEILELFKSNSFPLRIEDFHIGFEYLQYEMDGKRYLNKGMIWKKKKYGFDSPRLHKIKELIDNGEIARCNER